MKGLHKITWILLIIGGLNWLLIGLFMWGIGSFLPVIVARVVYILVGISAVIEIFSHKNNCKSCEMAKAPSMPSSTPNM